MAETEYMKALHGHLINQEFVLLDIYRLNCIFEASQPTAIQCQDEFNDPYRSMLDSFQMSEISRLVVSIAIFGRMLDERFTAVTRAGIIEAPPNWKPFFDNVGQLIPDLTDINATESLSLREAFNKILHATKMNFDENEGHVLVNTFLNPVLHLYGKKWDKDWKATLDVKQFIQKSYILVENV